MRYWIVLAACAPLLAGCEAMSQKVDASRQDRCERADWALVGERDGATTGNQTLLTDRYSYICGDMFKPGAYKEGYEKGFARRPKPSGT